jgi:hypothetical protein
VTYILITGSIFFKHSRLASQSTQFIRNIWGCEEIHRKGCGRRAINRYRDGGGYIERERRQTKEY